MPLASEPQRRSPSTVTVNEPLSLENHTDPQLGACDGRRGSFPELADGSCLPVGQFQRVMNSLQGANVLYGCFLLYTSFLQVLLLTSFM